MAGRALAVTGALSAWLLVTPAAVRAQTAAAPSLPVCPGAERIEAVLADSARAFATRNASRGLTLLREAFELSGAPGCEVQRAEATLRFGLADAYEERNADAAVKFAEDAATFKRFNLDVREAQALVQLSNALIGDGRNTEAVDSLRRARALARTSDDVSLQTRILSHLAYAMDEGPEKDKLREEGLAFARATPGARIAECDILHEWSDSLFALDRYSDAFPMMLDAVRCFDEAGSPNQRGRAYVSLGRLYRAHGRLTAALEQYVRALAVQQQNDLDRLGAIQSLNAIGVTLGFMGRNTEGLERLQEALGLARKIKSERTVYFLLANIATFQLDQGRYAEAAATLEEILRTPSVTYQVMRLADLSRAYVGLKRHDRALELADRALALARSESEVITALYARVDALIGQKRFEEASEDLRRALASVETIRANTVPDDFLKRGFVQRFQSLYGASIALNQDQGRAREAIEIAERARARAFLDLLATRRDAASSSVAAPVGSEPASFDDMVATATALHSTVLAYWVGYAETFVWVIHADGTVGSARIPVTATALASMIRDATGDGGDTQSQIAAAMFGSSRATRSWRSLYRLLIEPVRRHLPARSGSRLTIVPHGPLFGLPFAALLDPSGRYLIESYDLHYVPAIGALKTGRPSSKRAVSALLVGDPGPDAARDRALPLPALPWANREVATIDRLLPAHATVLRGRDATETNVRRELEGRTLLHFATHGIVQNEENLASYLALRPTDGGVDPSGDGKLTANETYGLKLDADLIVLSGCRTALGPIIGDGVIGFTRAFLAAGADSVLATMWDVADQTSYEVMRNFYGAWVVGGEKSKALRRAQLSVIRALRAGTIRVNGVALPESPRFWAGYVLVGRP